MRAPEHVQREALEPPVADVKYSAPDDSVTSGMAAAARVQAAAEGGEAPAVEKKEPAKKDQAEKKE